MAEVEFTREAREEAAALPRPIGARVERLLARLARWPAVSGAKPLSGELAGHWRMRTGDYRLQFRVQPGRPADGERPAERDVVIVERIGHRDGFYDDA